MDHRLRQQIQEAVLAAPDEAGRARLLADIVRTVYDPMSGDTAPVRLTVFEAEKLAAIIDAYARGGMSMWREAAVKASFVLTVRALEASGIPTAARDPWPDLAELPWPPPWPPPPGGPAGSSFASGGPACAARHH